MNAHSTFPAASGIKFRPRPDPIIMVAFTDASGEVEKIPVPFSKIAAHDVMVHIAFGKSLPPGTPDIAYSHYAAVFEGRSGPFSFGAISAKEAKRLDELRLPHIREFQHISRRFARDAVARRDGFITTYGPRRDNSNGRVRDLSPGELTVEPGPV